MLQLGQMGGKHRGGKPSESGSCYSSIAEAIKERPDKGNVRLYGVKLKGHDLVYCWATANSGAASRAIYHYEIIEFAKVVDLDETHPLTALAAAENWQI